MRKVPLADDVEPMVIARGTPGFSGADLANLCNEAALFAARRNKRTSHGLRARQGQDHDGCRAPSMVMSEDEKTLTAYHEAGHAIVGRLVPEHDPVYKVTIIPRGRALGVTMYLPEGDKYSMNRVAIKSQLCSLYGGRVAEELIFGADKVTTAPPTTSNAPPRWPATWSPSGACPTSSARSPMAKRTTRCSWAVRSPSTRACPTTPRAASTRKCATSSTKPTRAPPS
jgi:cell division protease FtsH